MKKLITIIFILFSLISFAQKGNFFGTYSKKTVSAYGDLGFECGNTYARVIQINNGGQYIKRVGVIYCEDDCGGTLPIDSETATLHQVEWTSGITYDGFYEPLGALVDNVRYWYRFFIETNEGITYSSTSQYVSPTCSGTVPTVTTCSATAPITSDGCTTCGAVTDEGSSSVTSFGVCYNTSGNPTTSSGYFAGTGDMSAYEIVMTGLSSNTTYYYRAYAVSSVGVGYGTEYSFTTLSGLEVPTLSTNTVTSITGNTATSGGVISSDGGATVTAKGVCWSTSTSPTTANAHTSDGTGSASYTSYLTALAVSTTYYVRAYATNSVGTAYGDQESFTTEATCTRPEGLLSYNLYANITIDGTNSDFYSTEELAKQACWDYNNKGDRTITIGAYTGQTTLLSVGNIVYLGAATNCNLVATGYYLTDTGPTIDKIVYVVDGVVQSYSHALRPTVWLTALSYTPPATTTNVEGSGYVVSDGGATVTERGFLWDTTSNPTLSSYTGKQICGSGTGTFQCATSPLTDGVRNYFKAYATNSAGTTYYGNLWVDVNVP